MVDAVQFQSETEAMLPALYRISYGILRAQADAEDAVQQALMKAWAQKHRAAAETFRAWLTRIVVNESRNIQRYRMRITPTDALPEGRTDAFSAPDLDVMDAIYRLPEKLRVPFLMKYAVGLSEKEVAHACRVPLSTVKSRLFHARQTLKDDLSDQEVSFT